MKLIKTKFKGLIIYKRNTYKDNRGYFRELFLDKQIKEKFPFDAMSYSKKNVLRGLHLQFKNTQSKYVNVLKGKILDVVIDLRKRSKTFGKSFKIILSKENAISLFIPRGFAHAYYSFEDENIIYYKLDNFYKPKYEHGIIHNDKKIKIKWPKRKMIVSKKDKKLKSFQNFCETFGSL